MERGAHHDLFLGAVMTTVTGSLRTTEADYTHAMKEMKENLPSVPERFRELVEEFDIALVRNVLQSEAADDVFSSLYSGTGGVCRLTRRNSVGDVVYEINIFEGARGRFLGDKQFTDEELDWLWKLAQHMHDESSEPVHRYLPDGAA